jgi:hypothetical protein
LTALEYPKETADQPFFDIPIVKKRKREVSGDNTTAGSIAGSLSGSPAGSRKGSLSPPRKKAAGGIKLKLKVSSPPAPGSPLALIPPIVGAGAVYSPCRTESQERKGDE